MICILCTVLLYVTIGVSFHLCLLDVLPPSESFSALPVLLLFPSESSPACGPEIVNTCSYVYLIFIRNLKSMHNFTVANTIICITFENASGGQSNL